MAEDAQSAGLSIGVIAPDLSLAGGAERLALQCVRRWQDRHRVTLYSRAFDEGLLEDLGLSALPRHGLAAAVDPRGRSRAAWLLDAHVLPRVWSRELGAHDVYLGHQWLAQRIERRPMVWYAHEAHRHAYDLRRERPDAAVAGEMGRLLEGEPGDRGLAADVRNDALQASMRSLADGAAPDRVVANSRLTAGVLAEVLGLHEVDVVYPGVDLGSFLEPSFEERFFLSVGSLHAHKRHRLAVEAVSLVEGARLVVAGRGPAAAELARMASRLGVQERVEIRTDVGDDELRRLYAGCRAAVFTAVNEPFGMVALEALAAGKPLLAVDQGGFTEVVDASCAMLTPPEPAALADGMRALLARPDEAQRMGRAGRKLAARFSWDRTARELESILIEAHRDSPVARRARPGAQRSRGGRAPGRDRTSLGVRVVCEYGDGAAEGAWREPGATDRMPRAGYYASHHESTLRRQLAEIGDCGFDFVVLSLRLDDRRLSPLGAAALRHALDLAPELGSAARFAVELVLEAPTDGLLAAALDWLARSLSEGEGVFEIDGRPLVLLRSHPGARRGRPPRRAHPALAVRRAPEPGEPGPLAAVRVADGESLARALRRGLAARPAPEALIVSSWNDHAAGEALEPTVSDDPGRLEAARGVLRGLREAR